jgi:ABC-2 type transport system ATP-binding protein
VAFAAAILHTPDILFLDEPFESIDPAGVAVMKQWLRTIVAQGRTVFMTSHVLDTVERLCDRVAIIRSPGRLVWEGDISSLATGNSIDAGGHACPTLEELYLHVAGKRFTRETSMEWV